MGGCCSCYHNDEPAECDKHIVSVHVSTASSIKHFIRVKYVENPDGGLNNDQTAEQHHDNIMRPRSISLSIHGGREGENPPGPEIEVDLEIPAIPYQVEHVRRMSSDDEADHICDVTRNEVIEYLGESLSSQNNEWRLIPPNKLDWPFIHR